MTENNIEVGLVGADRKFKVERLTNHNNVSLMAISREPLFDSRVYPFFHKL